MKKVLKSAFIAIACLVAGILVTGCDIFQSKYEMTEEEWETALKFDCIYSYTSTSEDYSNKVYVAQNKIKCETYYLGEKEDTLYLQKDGTDYYGYYYSLKTNEWIKEVIEAEDYYEYDVKTFVSMFDYENAVYSKEDNCYVFIDELEEYRLFFENKRLAKIENYDWDELEENFSVIKFSYDGFKINLPQLKEDKSEDDSSNINLGKVTAKEWSDAFDYSGKYMGTTTYYEDGEVSFKVKSCVTSNLIRTELYDKDNKIQAVQFIKLENGEWWHYNYDDESLTWERDEEPTDDYLVDTFAFLADIFKYELFTYNAQTCKYEAQNYWISIDEDSDIADKVEIGFGNNKVRTLSVFFEDEEYGELGTSVEFSYSDFTIMFPSDGDDGITDDMIQQVGPITKQEWDSAFEFDCNYTYTITSDEGEGKGYITSTKKRIVYYNLSGNIEEEHYLEKKNSKYYIYYKEYGNWTKEEIDAEEFVEYDASYFASVCKYKDCTYNTQKGAFIIVDGDETYEIYFSNKKVSKIVTTYEDEYDTYTSEVVFSYSSFTITLPTVNSSSSLKGPITNEEWDTAFEFDCNYTYTITSDEGEGKGYITSTKKRIVYYDMSGNIEEELYLEKKNSKYYEYYKEYGNWVKREIDDEEFYMYDASYFASICKYNDCYYDTQKGAFIIVDGDETYEIYFSNKKVSKIVTTYEDDYNTYIDEVTFLYSSFTITLPTISSGSDSGESSVKGPITEQDWNNAFLNFNNNYSYTSIDGDYKEVVYFTKDKIKVQFYYGNVFAYEYYYAKEGDQYYSYYKDPNNNNKWTKELIDADEAVFLDASYILEMYKYKDAVYVESENAYRISIEDDYYDYDIYMFYFTNKKVSKIVNTCSSDGEVESYTMEFSYDSFSITLPNATIVSTQKGTVTKEEWDNAFEFDCNYSYDYFNDNGNVEIVYVTDSKIKVSEYDVDNSAIIDTYYEKTGSKYYKYYSENGNWIKEEITSANFEMLKFSTYASLFNYKDTSYDAETEEYIIEQEGVSIAISFNNSKISCMYITYYEGFTSRSFGINFSYNNFTITLPTI